MKAMLTSSAENLYIFSFMAIVYQVVSTHSKVSRNGGASNFARDALILVTWSTNMRRTNVTGRLFRQF